MVELAGYPDAPQPAVRVVRGGEVIAFAQLEDNGEGRWVFVNTGVSYEFCRSEVDGFGETPLG